jgi:hypothetical protein
MTKAELFTKLEYVSEDENISVVIADGVEHLDELEPGSVLNIVEIGYAGPAVGHTLLVEPR